MISPLLRHSVASATIRACGMALSLALSVVLVRLLEQSAFGEYAFALSIVALMGIPVSMGFPLLTARETARSIAANRVNEVWSLWRWTHGAVLLLSGFPILGYLAWLQFERNLTPEWMALCGAAAFLVPVLALNALRSAAMRGLGHPLYSQIPEALLRPLLIILVLMFWTSFSETTIGAGFAMMCNLGATLLVLLIGSCALWLVAPSRRRSEHYRIGKSKKKMWAYSALIFGLTAGTQTLGGNTDIIMLGFFKSEEDVAIYKVALSISVLVAFGLQSVNMIIMPRIASLYELGEMIQLQSLVSRSSLIVTVFSTLAFGFLFLFGERLIEVLFGKSYTDGFIVVLILAAGQLIGALFGSVMLIVNMTGFERYSLKAAIGFSVVNILLNLALLPKLGVIGAALATSFSLILFNFYLWTVARRRSEINTLAFAFLNRSQPRSDGRQ